MGRQQTKTEGTGVGIETILPSNFTRIGDRRKSGGCFWPETSDELGKTKHRNGVLEDRFEASCCWIVTPAMGHTTGGT